MSCDRTPDEFMCARASALYELLSTLAPVHNAGGCVWEGASLLCARGRGYVREMPWMAVPFSDADARQVRGWPARACPRRGVRGWPFRVRARAAATAQALSRRFGANSIPRAVLLDATGAVVCDNAVPRVVGARAGAAAPSRPRCSRTRVRVCVCVTTGDPENFPWSGPAPPSALSAHVVPLLHGAVGVAAGVALAGAAPVGAVLYLALAAAALDVVAGPAAGPARLLRMLCVLAGWLCLPGAGAADALAPLVFVQLRLSDAAGLFLYAGEVGARPLSTSLSRLFRV